MKIAISESRLNDAVALYLTREFDNLKTAKFPKFSRSTFYIDNNDKVIGQIIRYENRANIVIDYDLWKNITSMFSFTKVKDQNKAIASWAENYFGVNDVFVDYWYFQDLINYTI